MGVQICTLFFNLLVLTFALYNRILHIDAKLIYREALSKNIARVGQP